MFELSNLALTVPFKGKSFFNSSKFTSISTPVFNRLKFIFFKFSSVSTLNFLSKTSPIIEFLL